MIVAGAIFLRDLLALLNIEQRIKAINSPRGQVASNLGLVNRFHIVVCAGENRIAVYQRHNWPFMDLVYEYEAIKLRIASDADAGKISQEEYTVKMRAASSDYRADRSPLSNITAT